MRKILLSTILLTMAACSTNSQKTQVAEDRPFGFAKRTQASTGTTIGHDLLTESAHLLNFIQSDGFNADNCSATLNQLYQDVYELPATYFDRSNWTYDNAGKILDNLFQSRVAIRRKLGSFESKRKNPECVDAVRDALRATRFIEDYVGYEAVQPKVPKKADFRYGLYVRYNPNPEKNENCIAADPKFSAGWNLCSGDILLSRGDATVSAAIARIVKHDSQFSHLAIVYVDPQDHKPYTIEAHIENGVHVAPFKTYVSDGKLRSAQFRYANGRFAHSAAQRIYDAAKAKHFKYDFHMDNSEREYLSCTEVVNYAYALAQEHQQKQFAVPPLYASKIEMTNKSYVDGIGMTQSEIFSPHDMEVDYRFDLVSEWRDLNRMHKVWLADRTLTAIYDWMERSDLRYILYPSTIQILKGLAATPNIKRDINFFSQLIKGKILVPEDISRGAAETQSTMEAAADIIYTQLESEVAKAQKKNGAFPTPKEMDAILENIRKSDFQKWVIDPKAKGVFHKYLRAPNS